jgi:hypothetical protein
VTIPSLVSITSTAGLTAMVPFTRPSKAAADPSSIWIGTSVHWALIQQLKRQAWRQWLAVIGSKRIPVVEQAAHPGTSEFKPFPRPRKQRPLPDHYLQYSDIPRSNSSVKLVATCKSVARHYSERQVALASTPRPKIVPPGAVSSRPRNSCGSSKHKALIIADPHVPKENSQENLRTSNLNLRKQKP